MKRIIISTLLMFLNFCFVFSQHEIKLKSGETINGEVKSLLNGQLIVSFKGNNLKLEVSDIESIFFVKSTQSSKDANSDKGELKGVVTYFFNKNFGDRPDIGATVLINRTDSINGNKSLIGVYQIAQSYKSLITLGVISKDKVNIELKKLNADTEEGFKKLDFNAWKELLEFEAKALKLTVDGSGSYSVKLDAGMYEVIIVSKGRRGYTTTENLGQVYRKLITIKSGEVCNFDKRFDIE